MSRPIPFIWTDDGHMVPKRGFGPACDREFCVGEVYLLVTHEERSMASHRHYFAALRECWLNLPEDVSRAFATPDHLRKWVLIEVNYYDEKAIKCANPDEATKLAAFYSGFDTFARVIVDGNTVTIRTAKSQSMREMGKRIFEQSKNDVLDYCAGMIAVDRKTLERQATLAPSHHDEHERSPV